MGAVALTGRRKAKRIGDRETALRVARAIRERLARGEFHLSAVADAETFETYAQAWLKTTAGDLKASTFAFYARNLRRYRAADARSPTRGSVDAY